jgi:hypothetical protein
MLLYKKAGTLELIKVWPSWGSRHPTGWKLSLKMNGVIINPRI